MTLSKEEFCQQYVLNRANVVDSLAVSESAKEAILAYETIKISIKKSKNNQKNT